MRRLLLVRHCQAGWSEDTETRELSALGLEQADSLARWLQGHWRADAIVSSPYRRAIDTIRPFAGLSSLDITLDERLRERTGPLLTAGADHIAAAEACFADHSFRLDGAETGLEVQDRGWQAVEAALQSVNALPVLVSHGQLLSFTLARVDGTTGSDRWRAMTTPDVFLLEWREAGDFRVERVWDA